jgi:hypothetical protein
VESARAAGTFGKVTDEWHLRYVLGAFTACAQHVASQQLVTNLKPAVDALVEATVRVLR